MARSRAGTPQQAKPRSDAYVGLLAIALVAQIAGAVFFFLDWNQYPSAKPANAPAPGVSAGGQGGGAPQGGGQPPQGGGQPPQGGGPPPQAGQQQGMGGGMAGNMGGKAP